MFLPKIARKLIPRWRDFSTTIALGELDPIASEAKEFDSGTLLEKQHSWEQNRTVWHAADLIGAAFVIGKPEQAVDAANFLLTHPSEVPAPALTLAQRILDPGSERVSVPELIQEEPEQVQREIHDARLRLGDEPRNSILWVHLARQYTLLGLNDNAARAMRVACNLSPGNRFVLRSAARFFVHYRDPAFAHRLLRNADSIRVDPWLIAAELGVASAAKTGPRFAVSGRKVLADAKFSPFSTTELASALGTLELENGKVRQAKQLFRSSLNAPTENSLAQAEWASDHVSGLQVDLTNSQVPRRFEAEALQHFNFGNYQAALVPALQWLSDQPFSAHAAVFASYISSSLLENYRLSIDFLTTSLISNPGHPALINNLAFALANVGELAGAEERMRSADVAAQNDLNGIALLATRGLVCFRRGLVEEGRQLYYQAIERATKLAVPNYSQMATIYLAREEIRAKTPFRNLALAAAVNITKTKVDRDVLLLLERTLKMAESPESSPGSTAAVGD